MGQGTRRYRRQPGSGQTSQRGGTKTAWGRKHRPRPPTEPNNNRGETDENETEGLLQDPEWETQDPHKTESHKECGNHPGLCPGFFQPLPNYGERLESDCYRTLFSLVFFVHFRPNFTLHSLSHLSPLCLPSHYTFSSMPSRSRTDDKNTIQLI